MKKIIKSIGSFFKGIYNFFDKILITPITKLILKLSDILKKNAQGIEKLFGKKQSLIVISLIFAVLVFFLIDRESNMFTDQYTEILYNQPVTAIYNEEAYVVEGLPSSVDVILIGKRRHIFIAKQSPAKDVSVDLTGLKPGQHNVSLKYSQPLKSLNYKLDPSGVSIIIYDKVSETRELTVDVLHKDNLDSKLYIKDVKLDRSNVIIKGAQYKLAKVATVKALVDIDNISNPAAGEINLKEVPLVAYDTEGKTVDVEIVPGNVTATLKITSPSKEVPVKVVPTGNLAFGKAIKTMTTNVSSVVVYGEEAA
ncbi:MAG: CdaR family protein, partial [Bacilli bacterium]